jgi:ABC-type polysaccharide/polyol phosphate export permease
MTTKEYSHSVNNIKIATESVYFPKKIQETLDLLFQFMMDISPIIFEKSNIFQKLLPIIKIIKIGRLSLDFILKIINIWK